MRSARFQSLLLSLAFAAAVLMALAPVVSRWVQYAHAGRMDHAAMASHGAHTAMPAMAQMPADHHGMSAEEHARHMAVAAHKSGTSKAPATPADPHAAHGEACDYCMMASRLLPWLAVLLLLAPLAYRFAPQSPRATTLPASLRWPAHPVRGPPRFC